MNPVITIVTGTHNRFALLQDMIASVREQMPVGIPYDFVVVDAGSTDGTLEWLREQPDVTLIEDGRRTGAIDAFTRGAFAATGKYVLLANDDIRFWPESIMKALLYLETTPTCGAVAFADNRPSPGKTGHMVMKIGAQVKGRFQPVNYAQVGLYRKWLGDALEWWKAQGRMAKARSYGGDSALSALIWEHGFTVDAVDGVNIDDFIPEDDLRVTEMRPNGEADGRLFASEWPNGAYVADHPLLENPDREQLRVLYLPIYEPGHVVQKRNKRGLREALSRRGFLVWELDYLNTPHLKAELLAILERFKPHLMLTQLHGPEPLTEAVLSEIRALYPRMVIVNWNGDMWLHGLTAPDMLKLLRKVDLQTVVNATVLDTYQQHNINAAYWQIGYEEPVGELPIMPAHDVVWLANQHSNRMGLYTHLRDAATRIEINVGIYGAGWPDADGECLYDFGQGAALYQNAKIALGDNQFPDAVGFVSNRLFQALAAGGALLLHQRVKGLEELTGITAGLHYVEWVDYEDLLDKLSYYIDPAHEDERSRIAQAGHEFVRQFHSFDRRVAELFERLLPAARARIGNMVRVVYRGPLAQVGARGHITGRQYLFNHGEAVAVDKEDARFLLQDPRNWAELKTQPGVLT